MLLWSVPFHCMHSAVAGVPSHLIVHSALPCISTVLTGYSKLSLSPALSCPSPHCSLLAHHVTSYLQD